MKKNLILLKLIFLNTLICFGQEITVITDINEGAANSFNTFFSDKDGMIGKTENHIYYYLTKNDSVQVWRTNVFNNEEEFLLKNKFIVDYYIFKNECYVSTANNTYSTFNFSKVDTSGSVKLIINSSDQIVKFVEFDGKLYYTQDNNLMSISSTGTIEKIHEFYVFSGIRDFVATSNKLFVLGGDQQGTKLFVSNGKKGNMTSYFTLNTGNEFNQRSYMTAVDTNVYFFYNHNNSGYKLWFTDGTNANTKSLKTFEDLSFTNQIKDKSVISFKQKFIFRAKEPNGEIILYESNGTTNGTKQLLDTQNSGGDSEPLFFHFLNDMLYLISDLNTSGYKLYEYDGTNLPKRILNDYVITQSPFVSKHDELVFAARKQNQKSEILAYNNKLKTTKSLTKINDSDLDVNPQDFTISGSNIYFTGNTSDKGRELYVLNYDFISNNTEISDKSLIQCYPNPTYGLISCYLESIDTEFIDIHTLNGVLIFNNSKLDKSKSLDLSTLEKGVYIITIKSINGEILNKSKLIKL